MYVSSELAIGREEGCLGTYDDRSKVDERVVNEVVHILIRCTFLFISPSKHVNH